VTYFQRGIVGMKFKGFSWEEYAEFWKKKEHRAPKPNGLGCWWEVLGESKGYFAEIARPRFKGWRESEAQQSTRFGQHWVEDGPPRPNWRRAYTVKQSPYDPKSNWNGFTAFPPRVGAAAPERWPAEAPGLRPHGLRPYEVKWLRGIASRTITDRMRLSNDPYNYQRLRDLKAHILERRRHSGSLFRDREAPTSAQFARGIRKAEIDGIELYRKRGQLRWYMDAPVDDEVIDQKIAKSDDPYLADRIPHGRDSQIAALAGFKFQELDNTIARRRRKYGRPLRERRKAGRKPLGDRAMTTAERVRKHREKSKAPAPHGRSQTGVVQPPPLGPTAPVIVSENRRLHQEKVTIVTANTTPGEYQHVREPRRPRVKRVAAGLDRGPHREKPATE
jgi:hypothetical protein